jgi:hypothetical protein
MGRIDAPIQPLGGDEWGIGRFDWEGKKKIA